MGGNESLERRRKNVVLRKKEAKKCKWSWKKREEECKRKKMDNMKGK